MPQIVLHLILLSNHKKSKKERRITEIFLQRIPFSLKNYFCLGGVWLSLLGTNAQVLLSARLPSPSSLRDATSPKVRGLGSPQSLQFSTLRPAAARGAVRRHAETFRLCQGLPLWGSWREAPERARMLAGRLRVSFDQTYDKSQCRPLRRGGAASDWESYHLNPHFLKYRIRFPACQRAGFRLRWAARCHAWMAVYWGTR